MCRSIEKYRNFLIIGLLSAACCAMIGGNAPLRAAAVVFSNQTTQAVTFVIGNGPNDKASQKAYKITPGDVLPVSAESPKTIWFDAKQLQTSANHHQPDIQSKAVKLNAIYTFVGDNTLSVKQGFSLVFKTSPTIASFAQQAPNHYQKTSTKQNTETNLDTVAKIPIMILVDDDEPRRREIWEKELRERINEASNIFEQTCCIRFEIVKVGTWETDDRTTDFDRTFDEFQRQVKPEPGIALAIGFTSQYEVQTKGRFHMGGTRGPLYPYILIREWSQHAGKPERLELLVHELGHVFGATHTPDQSSVMRPVVGDNQSNAKSFRIGFDPLNTLTLYLFCEPIRLENVRSLRHYSPESRANLVKLYEELGKCCPNDNSAAIYRAALQRSGRSHRLRRP